jgi:hypothetical protein
VKSGWPSSSAETAMNELALPLNYSWKPVNDSSCLSVENEYLTNQAVSTMANIELLESELIKNDNGRTSFPLLNPLRITLQGTNEKPIGTEIGS